MGKCPIRRKCTGIDKELLIKHSVSPERLEYHFGSERLEFEHFFCEGKGRIIDRWSECAKFNPNLVLEEHDPIKENRNMKIGIYLGIIIGVILFLTIEDLRWYDGVSGVLLGIVTGIAVGAFYGIGFSSIWLTISSSFLFLKEWFSRLGCLGVIALCLIYYFAIPFAAIFGVFTIVGIVRYFIRRRYLKKK